MFFWPIIIVISPLNSLINDQIAKLASAGLELLRPSVLKVKRDITGSAELLSSDVQLIERGLLKNGHYNLVFAHPESFLSCTFGRELLNSKVYQENVCTVVIDEAI